MTAKPTYLTTPPVRAVDLASKRRVHLVGIGGAGMSAIATVLVGLGHHVQGSDQSDSAAADRLRALGVQVWVGHDASQIEGADVIARSTAIPDRNPEVALALASGVEVLRRDELLAAITSLRESIAVGGTHGKTTTSSMLTVVLRSAGHDPSFIIGGRVQGIGTGAMLATGNQLVVEADESDGTFLRLDSASAIVTSVEPDHLDYYGSVEVFEQAFVEFLRAVPGPRIVSVDDEAARRVAGQLDVTTYGTHASARWHIRGYEAHRGGSTFSLVDRDRSTGIGSATDPLRIMLKVPGVHNARNATAAALMGLAHGLTESEVVDGLSAYAGVARRYEQRGEVAGITFVDDYAHLPSEVALTLEAARAGDWTRIICVFQPHRYTRTGALGAEFRDAFGDATRTYITAIYAAGESPVEGVTGRLVSDAIASAHPDADVHYIEDRADMVDRLIAELRSGDLCLTLGAGDLTTLPEELMTRLESA